MAIRILSFCMLIFLVLLYSSMRLSHSLLLHKYANILKIVYLAGAFFFTFFDIPIVIEKFGVAFTPRSTLTMLAGIELADAVIDTIKKKRRMKNKLKRYDDFV